MQLAVSAGIIGATPRPHLGLVRLSALGDIERLFGQDVPPGAPWHATSPALVAAALALVEDVPRVIVAGSIATLADEVRLVIVPGPLTPEARAALAAPSPEVPVYADLPPGVTRAEIEQARARGVRFVHPGGGVLLPGRRRTIGVGGATLALPLLLGRAALGPLAELHRAPLEDELAAAGVLLLGQRTFGKGAPRVVLGPGEAPLERSSVAAPTPSDPIGRLEAALGQLAERFTHRFDSSNPGLATLEREAQRLFQSEKASGAITGFALSVLPEGDDIAIEALVTLPKRVGQVIIRLAPTRAR